jgi:dTDP-4-dehydrorhamnose 3,5-epimerase
MALEGTVYDVVVDIRKGSPTFGRWYGIELSDKHLLQIYIPPGCAHGFCVTSETATFLYKCTAYYSPRDERGILWNDPALRIDWPISEPILSPKDQAYRTLKDMDAELPFYKPSL